MLASGRILCCKVLVGLYKYKVKEAVISEVQIGLMRCVSSRGMFHL